MKKRTPIIRSVVNRIVAIVLLLVLPINLITLILVQQLIASSNDQVESEITSSMELRDAYLSNDLNMAVERLIYERVTNADFIRLSADISKEPVAEWTRLTTQVADSIGQIEEQYENVDLVYFYVPENDIMLLEGAPGMSREALRAEVRLESAADDRTYGTGWVVREVSGLPTLISFTRWRGAEFGIMLNLNRTGRRMDEMAPAAGRYTVFSDPEGRIFSTTRNQELDDALEGLPISEAPKGYELYRQDMEEYGLVMLQLAETASVLTRLSGASLILTSFAVAFTILAVPFLLISIRRWMFRPINDLTTAMQRVEDGDLDYRIKEHTDSEEFAFIDRRFNEMMDEVQDLKIDVYEKELEKRGVIMEYLSRQIQPHFILNSLNILYSYEPEEYELSRRMIMSISKYFRFIVYMHQPFVTVKQEMDFLTAYLDIQKARFPDMFFSIVEYDPSVADCLIPPLAAQTLTENAIKHSLKVGIQIHIYVLTDKTEGEDGEEMLRIRIADTGEGITDEILSEIHAFQETGEPQEHLGVGIRNTIERLKYLYDDKTTIEFERDEVGPGTNITLMLPLHREGEEADKKEGERQ